MLLLLLLLLPPLVVSPRPGSPVHLPSSASPGSPCSDPSQTKEDTLSPAGALRYGTNMKTRDYSLVLPTHSTAYLPRPQISVTTPGVHAMAVRIHDRTMPPLWCFFVRAGLVDGEGLPGISTLQGPFFETWWRWCTRTAYPPFAEKNIGAAGIRLVALNPYRKSVSTAPRRTALQDEKSAPSRCLMNMRARCSSHVPHSKSTLYYRPSPSRLFTALSGHAFE